MSNLLKSKFLFGVMVLTVMLGAVVALNPTSAAAANCSITSTLRVGSKGAQVQCLQTALGITADGSFGPKTKAAVIAFQKNAGLVADGIFGAKSRAQWMANNGVGAVSFLPPGCTSATGFSSVTGGACYAVFPSTLPAGCTSTAGFSSTTGASCATGQVAGLPAGCTSTAGFSPTTGASCATGVVVPGQQTGPVTAALSTDNPASAYIIGGQAGADLLHVNFMGNGTVNSVTLRRTGVSDSSTLTNVYLYNGATRLTSGYSFNTNGDLVMNNLAIAVNGSVTISVRGDVASGQPASSLGIMLTSFTAAGNAATIVSIRGNDMTYGTGTLAGSNFSSATVTPAATSINAGSTNQNLWSRSLTVSQHAVKLHAMTVKMIGSAPSGSLANVALYVDGTNVATSTINSSMQFVFSLATPLSLPTGSHLVEVHGDVVSGAFRNFYLSLEQGTDLAVEDSNMPGVYVSTTSAGVVATNVNGGLVTINQGTLTINQDTAFNNTTTLVGGATNVKMAAFKFTSYGEDVKVNNLTFTPTIPAANVAATSLTSTITVGGVVTPVVTTGGGTYLAAPAVTVTQGTATCSVVPTATATVSGGAVTALAFTTGTCTVAGTLAITIATPLATTPSLGTLANVGLYVNGGQVGSNQTATNGGALTFNSLGGQLWVSTTPVTVEIRGDVMTSANVNYTAGTIKFNLVAGASNAQGVTSSQLTSTSAASGQQLTVASSNVTFGNTTGFAASTKAPNQTVKIGSFTVQTGSAEGITVNSIMVDLAGTLVTGNQLTNLTIKDDSTGLPIGTPIGNPVALGNNFNVTVPVGISSTKVFSVWGTLGSNTGTVTPSMTIVFRGATSNLSTTSPVAVGITTTSGVATIAAAGTVFVPGSSPSNQFVIGGSTIGNMATFNIKTSNNVGGAVIKDMTFTVPANTISTITVNGKVGTVSSVTNTATVSDVGLTVPSDNSGVNFPVAVTLICAAQGGGCSGVSNSPVTLTLTSYTFNDGSTIQTVTPAPVAVSGTMILATTTPSLAVASSSTTGFGNGTLKVGEVTISADAGGDIKIQSLPIVLNIAGAGAITAGSVDLRDSSGTTTISGVAMVSGGAATFVFSTPRSITHGQSETFTVYATYTGVSGAAGTQSTTFSLGPKASFLWTDVAGNVASIPGTNIFTYSTNSQTKTN